MSAGAPPDTDQLIRQLRRKRRRVVQRRRRRIAIALSAAGIALGSALGIAGMTGTDLAGAAAVRATNLMDLIDQRSPGVRTEGQLTKMRHMAMAPPEGLAPPPATPVELAQFLSPPGPAEAAVGVAAKPSPLLFAPPVPGGIFMTPSGGGGGPSSGGGGGPGGGGGSPPGSPPIVVPQVPGAVPEPGTWMTMLLGFALMGWTIRRQRPVPAAAGAAR